MYDKKNILKTFLCNLKAAKTKEFQYWGRLGEIIFKMQLIYSQENSHQHFQVHLFCCCCCCN